MFGLLIGAVIILSLISFIKPKTITTNKAPVVTQTSTTTPTPTKPTTTTPTTTSPTTVAPIPAQNSKLTDKPWRWVNITYSNGAVTTPRDPSRFIATFKADGTFSTPTDCNGVGGKYTLAGNTIVFSEMMSTLMYCTGSQESEYRKIFEQAQTYTITKAGDLRIDMKFGAGYALFR